MHSTQYAKVHNRSKNVASSLICGANNVVEHYGKRIEILHRRPLKGWPNRSRPSHPFWQKSADWLNGLCPVRSALKRTSVQDFSSFCIIFHKLWMDFVNVTSHEPMTMSKCPTNRKIWIFHWSNRPLSM